MGRKKISSSVGFRSVGRIQRSIDRSLSTDPENNDLHPEKIDNVSFWDTAKAYFQGLLLLVLGSLDIFFVPTRRSANSSLAVENSWDLLMKRTFS